MLVPHELRSTGDQMEIYRFMLSPRVVTKNLFTHITKALLYTKRTAGYFKGRWDLQFHKHFVGAEII